MAKLSLKIVTPERIVYEDSADSVSLMTQMGEITILPNHSPLVSLLKAGEMIIRDESNEHSIAVSTGLVEIRPDNTIIILADTADRSEELELEKIEEAKKLAEKRLEEARSAGKIAYADATAHLEKELARLKVARKGKYRDVGKQI